MNPHQARPGLELPADSTPIASDVIEGATSMISKLARMMPPPQLAPFQPELKDEWLFWASVRLSAQFRDLGMACLGNPRSDDHYGFITDEPSALTPVCAWHTWLIALAQRGAVEIRQLEMLDNARGFASNGVTEINTVAMFAGCTDPRQTGRRLSKALRAMSQRVVERCEAQGFRAQFVFGSPVQAKSPVTQQSGVPFTACRIRAEGMNPEALMDVLRASLCAADGKPSGEVLVLSNLWLDPA